MNQDLILEILDAQERAVIILNKKREIVYTNSQTQKYLGDDIHQILGGYFNCAIANNHEVGYPTAPQCHLCALNKTFNNIIATGEGKTLTNVEVNKNGMEATISIKISFVNDHLLLELFDFNLKDFKMDLLIRLADQSKDILFFKDQNLKYVYVNQMYADFLGKTKDEILGKTDTDLVAENLLTQELSEQCLIGDEMAFLNGQYYDVEQMGDYHFRVSKEYVDGGILGMARNITDEVKASKKAERDQLTGLYNRHKLRQSLDEIFEHQHAQYEMALIDLDNLRELNNEYGHLKGDIYLKALGKVLKAQPDINFFRIGGDEFVGLIDKTKVSAPKVLAEIYAEMSKLKLMPKLSISAGLRAFELEKTYEENYQAVDQLLYQAKANGKNQFVIG